MGVFFLGQVALVQSGSGKTPLPTQKRASALDFELKFEFHPAKLEEKEAGVNKGWQMGKSQGNKGKGKKGRREGVGNRLGTSVCLWY